MDDLVSYYSGTFNLFEFNLIIFFIDNFWVDDSHGLCCPLLNCCDKIMRIKREHADVEQTDVTFDLSLPQIDGMKQGKLHVVSYLIRL